MIKQSSRIVTLLENILLFAFILIIIDCILTGYGHWFMIGPFTLRIILWIYCIIVCIPLLIIKKESKFFISSVTLSVLLFGIYFIIQGVRGSFQGNDIQVLRNDIRAYSWIALTPTSCLVLNSTKRLKILIKLMVVASLLFITIILLSFLSAAMSSDGKSALIDFVMRYELCYISRISKSIIRFSCGNILYIIPTIIFLFFRYLTSSKQLITNVILSSFGLIVLLFTYTRSYYLGAILTLIITIFVAYKIFPKSIRKITIFIVLVMLFSVSMLYVFNTLFNVNYLIFAIQRIFPNLDLSMILNSKKLVDTAQSISIQQYIELTVLGDSIRRETMDELIKIGRAHV